MTEKLLTIGRVAEILGTSVKTIRYYHDINLLPAAEVSSTGRRYYSVREVWQLQLILTLRHMGFGLADIRKIVSGSDILSSIKLQMKLIQSQIEHQSNILTILEAAIKSGSDEDALRYIHDIGQEVIMERAGREALISRIESVLVEEGVPVNWKQQMLQPFLDFIGTDPTKEQLSARQELFDMLNDVALSRELQEKIAPFWAMIREQRPDADRWNQDMQNMMTRAWTALTEGHGPESREMQELASEMLHQVAKSVNVPVTPIFAELFAQQLRNMTEGSFRRFWELVSVDLTIQPHLILDGIAAALHYQLHQLGKGEEEDDSGGRRHEEISSESCCHRD